MRIKKKRNITPYRTFLQLNNNIMLFLPWRVQSLLAWQKKMMMNESGYVHTKALMRSLWLLYSQHQPGWKSCCFLQVKHITVWHYRITQYMFRDVFIFYIYKLYYSIWGCVFSTLIGCQNRTSHKKNVKHVHAPQWCEKVTCSLTGHGG